MDTALIMFAAMSLIACINGHTKLILFIPVGFLGNDNSRTLTIALKQSDKISTII